MTEVTAQQPDPVRVHSRAAPAAAAARVTAGLAGTVPAMPWAERATARSINRPRSAVAADKARVAWVAREDVAQVVAAVLVGQGHEDQTYDVTGPDAFGIAEAAARLSALTDRTVRYEEETPEAGRQWRAATGAAEHEVDVWIGSYLAMASGELSATSDTVERLVGRKPMTLEAYFAKYPARLGVLGNR